MTWFTEYLPEWNEQTKMVKFLSLLGKGSQITQRILAGVLFLVFSVILSNFSGLYIAQAQLREGTPDERLTLQLIRQKVFKENAAYRFNPEKKKGKSLLPPAIIKTKKDGFKKPVPDKKKFKIQIPSLLICENLYLEFTVNTGTSYQVTYLALPSQGRDPPYIP